MVAWHSHVAALTEHSVVLTGPTLLPDGVDASRVQIRIGRHDIGALAAAVDNEMAVLVRRDVLGDTVVPNARVDAELTIGSGQLRTPQRPSQKLLGVDVEQLDDGDRRWVRHAVLFVVEATDPAVRSARLDALQGRGAADG